MHAVGSAAMELTDSRKHPSVDYFSNLISQLPLLLPNQCGGGNVADIQTAGSIFLTKVDWIEHAAAADLLTFVGVPIQGMRVGITYVDRKAVAIANEPQHCRL